MSAHPARPMLRLVGDDVPRKQRLLPPGNDSPGVRSFRAAEAERRVEAENRRASGLSATDARWVLAVQVARSLDGGRAAVLPPERRRSLMVDARRMGLRDFDASLVIAIVQDGARTGADPLGREVADRLELVPSGGAGPARSGSADDWRSLLVSFAAAASIAGVVVWLLARWVVA